MTQLTPEQLSVVPHPLDKHARVLAVSGTGKSTTAPCPRTGVRQGLRLKSTLAGAVSLLKSEHAFEKRSIPG